MTTRTVPPRARTHLLANPQKPLRHLARALGIAYSTVRDYRGLLIREGALLPRYARKDLEPVVEALTDGVPVHHIARGNQTSVNALRMRLRRAGMSVDTVTTEHVYSGAQVLRMLGYHSTSHGAERLKSWQGAGLQMTPSTGRGSPARITATALQEFLESPQCPLEPTRIADPDWRAYAVAARAGKLKAPVPLVEAPEGKLLCPACRERVVSRAGRVCRSCGTKQGMRKRAADAPR